MSDAIKEARAAAREIVRRVEKSGESAAKVVQEIKFQALDEARFAALDLDADVETEAEAVPARDLDLPPVEAAVGRSAPNLPFSLEV